MKAMFDFLIRFLVNGGIRVQTLKINIARFARNFRSIL